MASNFGPGWGVLLLPYIEQAPLYNLANVPAYPGVPWTIGQYITVSLVTDRTWRGIRGVTVKTYLCPSDGNNATPYNDPSGVDCPLETGWARGNYACSAGYTDYDHTVGGN